MAFGDRLRLARLQAGLSLAGLAERLDNKVSAQAINKYELGKMMPSSGVLVSLAKALGVSLDFLMSSQVVALEGVEFRHRASALEREKAFVESQVIDHVERYLAIEEILDIPSEPSALDEIEPVIIDDADGAEEEASNLRQKWDLGGHPIRAWPLCWRTEIFALLKLRCPKSFRGVTCRVKRGGSRRDVPVIVFNSINVERNASLWLTSWRTPSLKTPKRSRPKRPWIALLRPSLSGFPPQEGNRSAAASLAYQELVRLKHLYGVSMMALLHRLKDVGIISDASLKNLFRTPARAWLKN